MNKEYKGTDSSSDVWAITCYFNPIGYRRRLANYHVFRSRLNIPLATVELAFGETSFKLNERDADVLVQIRGQDVMWQKERLLNLALQCVPETCKKVIWIDADVILAKPDWHVRVSEALDHYCLVQPFGTSFDLPPEFDPSRDSLSGTYTGVSLIKAISEQGAGAVFDPANHLRSGRDLGLRHGLVWAARTEILRKHGIYDACIIGTGDRAINMAALGKPEYLAQYLEMTPAWFDHYLQWARSFFVDVRGSVGYIEGDIYHLWHGSASARNARKRNLEFKPFQFDPFSDIALSSSGVWRWGSRKPDMHQFLVHYFHSRREDTSPIDECRPT